MENEEVYRFLFQLQESGRTNMWGAVSYMRREFPFLSEDAAEIILFDWMKRYAEIKKDLGV